MPAIRYLLKYLTLCIICPLIPHPKLRAYYLRMLGARIGKEVRVENIIFIQIQHPLRHLILGDGAFVGSKVIVDLSRPLAIGARAAISPGCTLLTHQDFGSFNGSRIAAAYPPVFLSVTIGDDVAIGADTTVLCGSEIGKYAVVGAKSLVRGKLPGGGLYIGVPAKKVKTLDMI